MILDISIRKYINISRGEKKILFSKNVTAYLDNSREVTEIRLQLIREVTEFMFSYKINI